MTWKCIHSGCGATLPGLSERIISFDKFAAMKARIATLEAALDECYEAGRPPTSDELDRLKVPTAPETGADEGCSHCGSMEVNPNCPQCQGIERDAP